MIHVADYYPAYTRGTKCNNATKHWTDEAMQNKPVDILQIWEGLDMGANTSTNQLIKLAIYILTIVANSAGAECFFSLLGIIHTKL